MEGYQALQFSASTRLKYNIVIQKKKIYLSLFIYSFIFHFFFSFFLFVFYKWNYFTGRKFNF